MSIFSAMMRAWFVLRVVRLLLVVILCCVTLSGAGQGLAAEPAGVAVPKISAAELRGSWLGVLTVGAHSLRLGLILEEGPAGALRGRFRQIDPKVTERELPGVEFDGVELRFALGKPDASYVGRVERNPDRIVGTWRQKGVDFPLVFERVDTLPGLKRPQEPTRPLPYDEEEVRVSAPGGVVLGGTLTRPRGAGKHPAIILISGSGPQDRDESAFGHKPFLVLSDELTRRGFAVLRLDDRGVGASTGDVYQTTLDELADDVLAALEVLAKRDDIDAAKISLVGHSEGGIVATIAAAKSDRVSRVVMLASPVLPTREVRAEQTESLGRSLGASDSAIAAIREFNRAAFDAVEAGQSGDVLMQTLAAEGKRLLDAIPDGEREQYRALAGELVASGKGYATPWFRSLLSYDPVVTLGRVRCPILAVYGGKDVQVRAESNGSRLEALIHANLRERSKVVVMPQLNHMLQRSQSGAMSEYVTIEETIAPGVLEVVGEWLASR